MTNTQMMEKSMLMTRVADLLYTVFHGKVPQEFKDLRSSTDYAVKAFEHYSKGFNIVYFDAAMYMRYHIEVLKKKEQENCEYFKYINNGEVDPCFGIAIEHLQVSADDALEQRITCKGLKDSYMTAVKSYLEPYWSLLTQRADEYWKNAETMKTVIQDNHHGLANAMIERAVRDFEAAISGYNITKICGSPEDAKKSVETFAKKKASKYYTTLDIEDILKKIERTYRKEFIPMVNANAEEILTAWERHQKRCDSTTKPWKCPNCGGDLHIGVWNDHIIECSGCNLSAPIPMDVYRERLKRKKVSNARV